MVGWQLIGQSNFVNSNQGNLFISTSLVDPEGELNAAALQHELASFGDLRSFQIMDTQATVRPFFDDTQRPAQLPLYRPFTSNTLMYVTQRPH
jgi:hypothetical protein